jgi:hypothetical protein
VESCKNYFYRNKNYQLPWSKNDFLSQLEVYQHKGVLGIKLGNRKKAKQDILKLQLDGVITDERDSVLFIYTDQPGENNIRWKMITREIKNILK